MLNATLRGGTLKDFEVLNKLGEGSFSQVFKVKRLSDAQEYAMKKVKMQLLKDKEKVCITVLNNFFPPHMLNAL
jgi:NIMA (never in mitosis gene a)-related kinase